ncbi:disease resistance protein RPP2B-like [Rutidosis leptorrhynchoides]|uniref:disease resistance protein RPP2B-like n=1 Tax=Rutidosis leptorrhynchoides TaxID=125765 RepID=UPI003A99C8C4
MVVIDPRETDFIEEVVTNIHRRIGGSRMTTLPYLFGMKDSIEFVTSWLKDGASHNGDILTISGMGGFGKSSLARYVYGLHSHLFERSSLIIGISKKCAERVSGLLDLHKQLCSDISKIGPIRVHDELEYTVQIEKLCLLLGKRGFHLGSKIIITTKDASLTKKYASSINPTVQPEHKHCLLKGLNQKASLKLLCHHAFMSKGPNEGYEQVSKKLMEYCEGHPLALKVLGESLHNNTVAEWEDRIQVLKEETDSRINNVLRTSFDSIPSNNDKELFKHISCFFVGQDRGFAGTILNACDIHTLSGFRNLIDRCLLETGRNDTLRMHSLIQEMGRDVVRQESIKKPWKRSLLWCHEESLQVLKQRKGTGNIKGLSLNMKMLKKEKLRRSFQLHTDALSEMDNLKILHLDYMQINGFYENFPEELRWLRMHGFLSKVIPFELPVENLVALDLSYSNIESFGMCCSNPQPLDHRQKQLFGSLKILDLRFCEHLQRLSSFLELPALERLILRNCISLIEICESLEHCVELVLIDLSYCNKLEKFPRAIHKLKKLETLFVDGFNTCEHQIKVRDTDSQPSSSAIVEAIPRKINFFEISFLSSLVRLSLAHNNLSNESFPENFSFLSKLEYLCLDGNPIVSMPNFVRSLIRLETLGMEDCQMLTSIEHPPSTLQRLFLTQSDSNGLLRRIVFDPEMSPPFLRTSYGILGTSSAVLVEGIVKKEPMADVDENLLNTLGWTDLDHIKRRHFQLLRRNWKAQTQMYYEFGIFSIFYDGSKDMPNWISNRSQGKSISFSIPSSSKNLRGLNICCVQNNLVSAIDRNLEESIYDFSLPLISVRNITQNHTWIYIHCTDTIVSVDEKYLTFLSHWMFGLNEMVGGDQITITIEHRLSYPGNRTVECGVSFVYDADESNEKEEEEDVLGYYKSWNHIIGGDLSSFQTTTGEYILNTHNFKRFDRNIQQWVSDRFPSIRHFKGKTSSFLNKYKLLFSDHPQVNAS